MSAAEASPTWQATTLGASDNVAIVLEPILPGQDVVVNLGGGTTAITALEPIALGHKIALVDLRAGDEVTKYGECIGEATASIAQGAWVHIHNVRSRRGRHDNAATNAFDALAYVDTVAAALGMPVPPASREAVAANLTRLAALAHDVLAFEIPSSRGQSPSVLQGDDGHRDAAGHADG